MKSKILFFLLALTISSTLTKVMAQDDEVIFPNGTSDSINSMESAGSSAPPVIIDDEDSSSVDGAEDYDS